MQTAGALIFVINKKGKIKKFNRACELLTGYSAEKILDKDLKDLPFLSADAKKNHYNHCVEGSEVSINRRFESKWKASNGVDRTIVWSNTYLRDTWGKIDWIICTGIDITERKKAESALQSEKERLFVTLSSITDAVISTDLNGLVVLMNDVAEQFTGFSQNEATGRTLNEILNLEDEDTKEIVYLPISDVLKQGKIIDNFGDILLLSKHKIVRHINISIAPIQKTENLVAGVVCVIRDITQKRKFDEEMQRLNKLDSIGVLAGGIAHDFNNILTSIIGHTSLLKQEFKNNNMIINRLVQIENASSRANQLTQDLLTFSKGGKPIVTIFSLPALLKDTLGYLSIELKSKTDIAIQNDLWNLNADASQINQVIQNLIINADQSMPMGGTIKISAVNMNLYEENSYSLPTGEYIKLSITDQGVGIKKEYLSCIFDPYFTTKAHGRGFGLAICHSIILNHKGTITVDSKFGSGTTFTIILPASKTVEMPRAKLPTHESTEKKKGKILVMDDDDLVREIIGEMLREIGYQCEFAQNGDEAISAYKKAKSEGNPFDLLIIDLIIKNGMNGKEAIKKLRSMDPKIKAIVSSGYSTDSVLSDFHDHGFSGIVVKPYELNELNEAIAKVLK